MVQRGKGQLWTSLPLSPTRIQNSNLILIFSLDCLNAHLGSAGIFIFVLLNTLSKKKKHLTIKRNN